LSGVRVIAVDISSDKLNTAKELGADEVVRADTQAGLVIKDLGGADGCINFAPVGATWPLMLAACNPRAKIVLTAVPADQMAFYAHEVIERGLQVIGSSASNRQEMNEILVLAAGGKVKGVINPRPFNQINDALSELIDGTAEGRSVLTFD
jgi:propanol-preferring alcohol dehydrogenase